MTKDYAKAITKIKQWKPSKDAVTIDSFAIYIGFTVYDNEGNEYGDQGAVLDFFQLLKKDANFCNQHNLRMIDVFRERLPNELELYCSKRRRKNCYVEAHSSGGVVLKESTFTYTIYKKVSVLLNHKFSILTYFI